MASALLSLWAIYLDPVINNDGIYYVQAAQRFANGEWNEALSVYKWPFYSFIIGTTVKLTGLEPGQATYLINIVLHALLVAGFVAFVRALGGRGTVLWMAALVILLYPVMNKFRPFVIRDIGYWACYLWSLAYFFDYIRGGKRLCFVAWALFAFLAFLFRIEGLALLLLLPIWLFTSGVEGRWLVAARIAALGVGAVILSGFTLWQYVSESGSVTANLLTAPLDHVLDSWAAASSELVARLDGLQREFGDGLPLWVSLPVFVLTLLVIVLVESVDSLGVVYAGLVAYFVLRGRTPFTQPVYYWWMVMVSLQVLLLIAFGFLNFFLADRYPVGLALTLLAPLPFWLDELWQRWRSRSRLEWSPLVVAALLAVSSIEGLDVETQKRYLKDAGLWLRQQGTPDKSVYSNSVILAYYAGVPETGPRSQFSWEHAMKLIWTGDWRRYDYLAVMINTSKSRHERLIVEKIGRQPVIEFTNSEGDRVLVFSTGTRTGCASGLPVGPGCGEPAAVVIGDHETGFPAGGAGVHASGVRIERG